MRDTRFILPFSFHFAVCSLYVSFFFIISHKHISFFSVDCWAPFHLWLCCTRFGCCCLFVVTCYRVSEQRELSVPTIRLICEKVHIRTRKRIFFAWPKNRSSLIVGKNFFLTLFVYMLFLLCFISIFVLVGITIRFLLRFFSLVMIHTFHSVHIFCVFIFLFILYRCIVVRTTHSMFSTIIVYYFCIFRS